jgi:hypothetical protein
MAWETEPTIILREIISDPTGATYSDSRLKTLLATSMYRVKSEIVLDHTYEVDLTSGSETVTPDPSTRSPKDYDIINLMALKAAIILISAELKIASGRAVVLKDGPSQISTGDTAKYLQALLDWAKDEYDDLIKMLLAGNSKYAGAVSTPFTRYGDSAGWSINAYGTDRDGR